MPQAPEDADLSRRVIHVVRFMNEERIDLPTFLDALTWGNQTLRTDRSCSAARVALFRSDKLPTMLDKWVAPPDRLIGAESTLNSWAIKRATAIFQTEIGNISSHTKAEDVSAKSLLGTNIEEISSQFSSVNGAPHLCKVLGALCSSDRGIDENTYKTVDKVCPPICKRERLLLIPLLDLLSER
jgi:hypothetical protein